mgnify:CR=1 FL=1|jgi:hypothetical protein|tara:strand:- start:1421 stop:1600 length:180 start_codon:yes stop_codon:yes gene_type:complete
MIVKSEELKAATGYEREADIIRCLKENGIKYYRGKNGQPWTTLNFIEKREKDNGAIELI